MEEDNTQEADESVLYTLPPPPETVVSVRNLTLVANRSGPAFLRKLKEKRSRKKSVDPEKEDTRATELKPAHGDHREPTDRRGYVGEDANDRPVEPEEDDDEDERDSEGKKVILNNVSCECYPREMLAILGGSGSGKTSLLHAMRASNMSSLPIESGKVVGLDCSQGERTERTMEDREYRKRIGFVRQQDFLVEHLTVRETLYFAAALRLPSTVSQTTRKQIVDQTLQELGLMEISDTLVGGALRKGISGGQKRRLSIGCILVTLPSVLILDVSPPEIKETPSKLNDVDLILQEVTSGLDAFTAFLLLQNLSALAKKGRTIILSIHAPRSDAWKLFDRVVLLTKGQVAYSGKRDDCLAWFEGLGQHLETGINPLDFLIDITSIDNRDPKREIETKASVAKLVDAWTKRSEASSLSPSPNAISHAGNVEPKAKKRFGREPRGTARRASFPNQVWLLVRRNHIDVYRNYPLLLAFLFQSVLTALVTGLAFFQLGETPTDIQSLKTLTYQMCPIYFYLVQVFWTWRYCDELIRFDRDNEDGLYSPASYVLADFITWLLPGFSFPALFTVITFFLADIRTDAATVLPACAATFLAQLATQGLSFLCASLIRPYAQASIIANVVNLFQTMSAGFLLVDVPDYLEWVKYLGPQYYAFRILAVGQFRGRTFNCPTDTGASLTLCDGDNVLRSLNIPIGGVGIYFGEFIALIGGLWIFAAIALTFWKPGGVKHAAMGKRTMYTRKEHSDDAAISQLNQAKIAVEVSSLYCTWTRWRPFRSPRHRAILNDINMSFPAGELTSICGPSGGGKSTLLQILGRRPMRAGGFAQFGRSGQVLYGNATNEHVDPDDIQVAYVEQEDDWHLPALTVRETLRFAAILRLPESFSRDAKIARAEDVMVLLGLKDVADIKVGGELVKGISGGEKRRLSLAVEMINNPSTLLVDEPTSGLDASIALNVMQALKDIAASGKTVIVTVHQPRSDIWQAIDNLLLLSGSGTMVYGGKRADAVRYFEDIGYPVPPLMNPADHLLDVVSIDPRKANTEASKARLAQITAEWDNQKNKTTAESRLSNYQSKIGGQRSTNILVALPIILRRMWKNLFRQQEVFYNRVTQPAGLALVFLVYYQRLGRGPQDPQNFMGIIIQTTSAVAFVGLLNSIPIYPRDKLLFFHERQSSAAYSSLTFLLGYTLIELPNEIIGAALFGLLINVGVGLQSSARTYFEFVVTIWAQISWGESVGILLCSFTDSLGLSVSIVSTVLTFFVSISGSISLSVPSWLSGIAWIGPLKSAVKVQLINTLSGLEFNCTDEEVASGVCIAQTGDQILALYRIQDQNVPKFIGIMVATTVAWRLMALAFVYYRVKNVKKL